MLFSSDLCIQLFLFRVEIYHRLIDLGDAPLELLLFHLRLDLVEDVLLQLALFRQGGIQIRLQLGHLVPCILLYLLLFGLERRLEAFELFRQGRLFVLVLLCETAQLFRELDIFVLYLGFEGLDLSCHLLVLNLQFLDERVKTLAHTVLFQVRIQVGRHFVQATDVGSQRLRSALDFRLKGDFGG